MATILTRHGKHGTSYVIHYYGNDRKSRFYLCLGQKYRRRQVEEIKILVENLLDAMATKRRLYPEEDGNNWRDWLEDTLLLAEATAANSVVRTRTVFSWAQKNGYCQNNIFLDVRKGSMENKDKEFYIPIPWYEQLLALCPDQEWRVYLAMMRIGGVRSGEAHVLTWDNVLWNEYKVRIVSPKTERFKGHDERIIPMFKRLQKELLKLFEAKGRPTTGPVLTDLHHGRTQKAVDDQLKRMIRKAGFDVWPRLNHNLRGSRSNELFAAFPDHVAEYWMGHSKKVAKKHYLHVMADQYTLALDLDKEDKLSIEPDKTEPQPPAQENSPNENSK